MKKISALVIIFISIIIFFFLIISSLIDYTSVYKKTLKNSNIEIAENNLNDIKIVKFPLPYLYIENLYLKQQIQIEQLTIRLTLLSLLKLDPKIKSVDAKIIKIHSFSPEKLNFINHPKILSQVIDSDFKGNINIATLILLEEEERNITVLKDLKLKGLEVFEGRYEDIQFKGGITKTNNKDIFSLSVNHQAFKLKIDEEYDKGQFIEGKSNIIIKDLQYFISNLFSNSTNVLSNLNINEDVDISVKINYLNEMLHLKDIIITSKNKIMEGVGDIKLTAQPATTNLVNFNFKNINLVSNTTKSKDNIDYNSISFLNKLFLANIKIARLVLNEEVINNCELKANSDNDGFDVKKISGQFLIGGNFNINGRITNNNFRNIFAGNIDLTYNNFNGLLSLFGYKNINIKDNQSKIFIFKADFKLTAIDLFLQNIVFKTDNTQINGRIITKFVGLVPRIDAFLEFSLLNLNNDQYPFITPGIEFIQNLTENMDKPEYLNKFISIRKIDYIGNFDLTFNDLVLFNENFNRVNLYISLAPSLIVINNIHINKNEDFIKAKVKLEALNLKPSLYFSIIDGSLKVDFIKPATILAFKNKLFNNYNLNKVSINLEGKLSKVYQDNIILNNVFFNFENENNLIKITKFDSETFDGQLSCVGSILLEPYTYNIAYAINQIDLSKLDALIPESILEKSEGKISLNGTFSTYGENINSLFYNLYSKSKFSALKITIKNFSIDQFIKQINDPLYDISNVRVDIKPAILTGETLFEIIEGDLMIAKGLINFQNINLKTQYSTGTVNAVINSYKFEVNIESIFNFYYNDSNKVNDAILVELPVKAEGSYFQPSKTADIEKLDQIMLDNANREKSKVLESNQY